MKIKVRGKYKSVSGEEHYVYGYSSVYNYYYNEDRNIVWKENGRSVWDKKHDLVEEIVVENSTPEDVIKKIALEALDLGMRVRQDQLKGGQYHMMSGNQAFEEWWKTVKL